MDIVEQARSQSDTWKTVVSDRFHQLFSYDLDSVVKNRLHSAFIAMFTSAASNASTYNRTVLPGLGRDQIEKIMKK
jgi:hypothetical protein